MSTPITGFVDVPCPECEGATYYYIVGEAGTHYPPDRYEEPFTPVPREAERIDPCDYCHGVGTIPKPIYHEDASQPTPEDLYGYPRRDA